MCIYICVYIYTHDFSSNHSLDALMKKKDTANKTTVDSEKTTTTTENNSLGLPCIYSITNQVTALKETLQLSVYAKPQWL